MTVKNTRQKGRILVKQIIEDLIQLDPSAHEVVGSGQGKNKSDIQLPGIGVAIEAKNHSNFAMGEWIDDLEKERGIANDMVILGFRDPRTPSAKPAIYYVVSAADMFELLKHKRDAAPVEGRIPRWLTQRIKQDMATLAKYI